jgi:hypothetical protein
MRWILLSLIAVSAVPAVAANPSSFEGTYSVSLTPKPGLDGPTCPVYDLKSLRVEKGLIQVSLGQAVLGGTVNSEGTIDGHLRKADGGDVPFQLFVKPYEYDPTKIHIDGSIVDDRSGCGWTMNLVHE